MTPPVTSPVPSIDDLAARHWRERLATVPVWATHFGVHDHDDRVGEVTATSESHRRTEVSALLAEVRAASPADERERVIAGSVVAVLEEELVQLGGADGRGVPHAVLRCEQMDGPHQTLLRTMPDLTYPEPEQAAAVLDRYRAVDRYLNDAADRFVEGLELGFTPVARNVQRMVEQLDGYLDSDIADDGLVGVVGPSDWAGEAAWRDALVAAVRDHVRPAVARFRDRLVAEQLPVGRDDDHAGLSHVDPSGETYRRIAKVNTTLDVDPGAVHRTGVDYVTGPLAEEWSRLGAATLGESDPRALMDRMRSEPSLRYGSTAEVEAHAREAITRATAVMGDWFGRLPAAPCVVATVPAHQAASSPPAYYVQPAPDGSRPGTYYVNALDLDSMLRTEGEATAFHEAIPGHHLQLAISGELEDVPDFMRYGAVIAYAEGWGLYAERLADEMGLYASDMDRLGMLSLDAFRAARLVVDTGLHALGWSRQRAITWMVEHTPLPVHTIASEVDRYLAIPGQALSYKLGQLEIRRLRDDAEARLGDSFDIKAFHDTVLGSGMLTLEVLADVVDRWVAGRV